MEAFEKLEDPQSRNCPHPLNVLLLVALRKRSWKSRLASAVESLFEVTDAGVHNGRLAQDFRVTSAHRVTPDLARHIDHQLELVALRRHGNVVAVHRA